MARTRAEQVRSERKKRLKWGDPKLRMSVDSETVDRLKSQGKVARWVNDDGKGRIEKLQQRGYEFVQDDNVQVGDPDVGNGNTDLGSRVSRIVGLSHDNKPMRAYLMAQDRDFYEEDAKEKEAVNEKIDEAIRRGDPKGSVAASSDDGKGNKTYVKNVDYKP